MSFIYKLINVQAGPEYQPQNPVRMWCCSVILTFLLIIIGSSITSAQSQNTNTTPAPATELRVTFIEQNYDQQLIEILSNYFNRKKFYVDVQVNAEIAEEIYSTQQNKIRQQNSRQVLMPGLPYVPAENIQDGEPNETSETIINENRVKILRIANIAANIYADSSLTDEELNFMHHVAEVAIKAEPARGDVINISRVSIPDLSSQITTVGVKPDKNDSASLSRLFSSFNPYLLILTILLIIGLVIGINRYNQNHNDEDDQKVNYNHRRDRLKNDYLQNEKKASISKKSIPANSIVDHKITELEKLNKNFFSKPKATALLIESWIFDNKGEGANKAARVIKSIDEHSIKILKDKLEPTTYDLIKKEVDDLSDLTISEKQEIATEFNTLLERMHSRSDGDRNHGPLPLLQFLEHTSEDKLYQLISNVKQKHAALIIDHLPAKKAASLLDRLDKTTATDIMVKITLLGESSYKERKIMSQEVFDEAMNLLRASIEQQKYKNENILSILEELPLKEQRDYIEKLQMSEASVGEFVHAHLITLDQITEIEDKIIKEAISTLPTETLIDALLGLDEATKQKILYVRPQREQRLIKMELEQINNPDEYDTNYAQSILINSIRKIVRKNNLKEHI